MYIIYNLLMIGAFFLVMPYFIYRSICEKLYTQDAPEPWRYPR